MSQPGLSTYQSTIPFWNGKKKRIDLEMDCSCSCCVSLEKIEEDVATYGMELMNPPSSMDELLKLLLKVEPLLRMVGQYPSDSMITALQPIRKAVVKNELLRHNDEDVKVSVVSCITEISRIFTPKYPYDDHKLMEEILQQTLMVLKKLSDVTDRSYRKVVRILEIFAKVRVCVVLLELENESLVIKMFKILLEAIRPYHPHNIFTWMKEIMTRLIDESDELSVELLQPLLDSLKIDNQMDSPVASILGEKVLKDCSAIVKPYLAEAIKSMSLNSDDYAAIVALLCNEMPKGKEMDGTQGEKLKDTCTTNIMKLDNPEHVQPSTNVPKENQKGTGSHELASHPVKVGPSEAKFCEQVLQDATHRENLKDTCTTNIMKLDNPEDVQPAKNVRNENQEGTGTHKLIGHPVKVGPAEAKFCEPVLQGDTHREKLKDTCTANIMKPDNLEDMQPAANVPKGNQGGTGSHKLEDMQPATNVPKGNQEGTGSHKLEDMQPAKNVAKGNQEGTGSHKLTGHSVKVGPSEAKFCESVVQDDTHREKLKDTCITNIMKPDNPEDVQPTTNVPKENQEGTGSHKLTGSSGHHSLVSEHNNNCTGTHGHWCQPKKNEIQINEDAELVVLLPVGDVPQSQVQKKDSLHLGLTWGERTKRTLCAKRGRDSRMNESASDDDAERKSESSIINEEGNIKEHREPSLQQVLGMKQKKKKNTTTKMDDTEESGDKATKLSVKDENHLNKCANYKSRRKLATRKHEESKRARTSKDHGAELIGAKIKVWWPLEQVFYVGVISSFDSEANRHEVIYDDGEVEKLKLRKEQWELLEDDSSQKGSTRPCTIKKYGKELVGTRIKVWWPMDERFYKGVVSSFNPMTGKHQVEYDDGEVEKLRLHKERWELLEDDSSQEMINESAPDTVHPVKVGPSMCASMGVRVKMLQDSKRPCTIKEYGKELVGTRIKVWWASDARFYQGVVSSFNPVTRKHQVEYDGGEVEKLRLHRARWEMLEDNSSQKVQSLQDHGLDFQGHAVSSATSSKKKAKRDSSTGPNIS